MSNIGIFTREALAYLALALVVTLVAWGLNYGLWLRTAEADSLTSVSDTISNSDLFAVATHTIQYTNNTTTDDGETIRITFDPTTDRFDGVQNLSLADGSGSGNVTSTGFTIVSACGIGSAEVTLTTSTAANDESLIFTVCGGDAIATGTKTVTVMSTAQLRNPTSTNSYIIRIAGTQRNQQDARVAIIDDVVLTATVNTSLTFTINGVATNTTIGTSVTTTRASTPTTLPFGTLPIDGAVTLAQLLTVGTNANNGFVVTIVEDQNPLSASGADIDLFANGQAEATPIAWGAPSTTLDVETTYGHIGITSDDADLNGNEFATGTLFAGNFQPTTTRQVFSHTGPSDSTTTNKGKASVAFRIQIGALQEAAELYTNTFTYVATPTF